MISDDKIELKEANEEESAEYIRKAREFMETHKHVHSMNYYAGSTARVAIAQYLAHLDTARRSARRRGESGHRICGGYCPACAHDILVRRWPQPVRTGAIPRLDH